MNSRPKFDTLLPRAVEQIRQVLNASGVFRIETIQAAMWNIAVTGYDALATGVTKRGVSIDFLIKFESDPRPSRFPAVCQQREFSKTGVKRAAVPILAAPIVGPKMAEVCCDKGWGWIDLAGNCRISIPDLLYVERTGNAPVRLPGSPIVVDLGTHAAARIMRALLAPENAGRCWTQSEIHGHIAKLPRPHDPLTPPSMGLVNKVVRELVDETYLEKNAERRVRVRDAIGLLQVWSKAYRFDHPRHEYFTLLKGSQLRDALARLEPLAGGHAAYAAFSAAERQAPHVRQPKTWLFVAARYLPDFEKVADARVVESGANITVLTPHDDGVFYLQDVNPGVLSITNPAQTYVDVAHAGGRGEEAADAILRFKLKPRWEAAGMLQ